MLLVAKLLSQQSKYEKPKINMINLISKKKKEIKQKKM